MYGVHGVFAIDLSFFTFHSMRFRFKLGQHLRDGLRSIGFLEIHLLDV